MKYGVADIVHAATSEQENQEIYETMLGAVGQLMAACEASGEIRSGGKSRGLSCACRTPVGEFHQMQPEKRV
jgi:hypothetical protein